MKNAGLSVKIVSVVIGISSLILALILLNNYLAARQLMVQQAEEQIRCRGREVVLQLSNVIKPIEQSVKNIALTLEDSHLSRDETTALPERVVANNPDVFAMAIAFEPYGFDAEQHYFAPYSYRTTTGEVQSTMLGGDDYRYFTMDWYLLPKELHHPVWTEPYFDEGGGDALMTTYAVPFYRQLDGVRTLAGVVTADVSLDWLQKEVSSLKLYQHGYALVLSRNGTYISHPVTHYIYNETIFGVAEALEDQPLWELGRAMIDGKSGFLERNSLRDNVPSFVFYTPLPIDGWSVAVLAPLHEVLADVYQLTRNTLLIGVAGFVLLALATLLTIRRVVRPIQDLSKAALTIAGGDLNAELPSFQSGDEVGQLAESFRSMQSALGQYIVDLKETTAHNERIDSELRIARDIQMGILPKLFPAFPEHDEFDVFASLQSAREIGGDLYDFFFIDERHFCFLVGDVSGKGVPAALFMAVTKTLIKVVAERERQPHRILEKVNNDLAEDNDSCMFVTLFLAIINLENGEVQYSNAGHPPPVLVTAEKATPITSTNEPVAGAFPEIRYTCGSLPMAPGETLVLYTDGVTEAMDPEMLLYSDPRLIALLNTLCRQSASQIVQSVNTSVTEFARGAEQSDDITLLAFTYCGQPTATQES